MSGLLARIMALIVSLSPGGAKAPGAPGKPSTGGTAVTKTAQIKSKVPPGKAGTSVQTCPLAKGPFVSSNYDKYTEKVGDGYCAPFVQSITAVGNTGTWEAGEKLSSRPQIAPGTAIATFNAKGKYPNEPKGNHAAIFVNYGTDPKKPEKEGFWVYDQYRVSSKKYAKMTAEDQKKCTWDEKAQVYVKRPSKRFIPFNNPEKNSDGTENMSNNGDTYSVIDH